MRRMRLRIMTFGRTLTIVLLVCMAFLAVSPLEAAAPTVTPLAFELDGPGQNVDDPCFWIDPNDPSASLIFVTAKDSGLVEVFNLVSGALVTTIPGFTRPNNCAVEGDLLITTDVDAGNVKVHHLPDFALVDTFGEDMTAPEGVDVLTTPAAEQHVFVTDSSDSSVHVYDLATGALVRAFPTGFGAGIEPILADDRYQRIYVGRGEKEPTRGIGLFTPAGTLVREFAATLFSRDAEGMAVYACGDGGYFVVSDQKSTATDFEVFDRVTLEHIGTFNLQDGAGEPTDSTDGVDIFQTPLPGFPSGGLAACDGCGSTLPDEMDVVAWERIATALGLNECPNGTAPDCIGAACTERFVAVADATIASATPTTNRGTEPALEIERQSATTQSETLLRFVVPDLTGLDVLAATVRLTVSRVSGSDSDAGGFLSSALGPWSEDTVTFATRPSPTGPPLTTAAAVTSAQAVDFDVAAAVPRGGTYDFILQTSSANKARYFSREAGESPPALLLSLKASAAPTVSITSPAAGAAVRHGTPVELRATAADAESGDLTATIAWTSSLDGVLGQGGQVTASQLRIGTHVLTARVVDASGLAATDSVTLTVASAPEVAIVAPAAGTSVAGGTPVILVATAVDALEGDLGAGIRWSSDHAGPLGSGATIVATLSAGTHVVTAASTNASGGEGTASVTITVASAPPTVRIIAPHDGDAAVVGVPVRLIGRAFDLENGDLSAAIVWESDRQSALGTGAVVDVTGLAEGLHHLTARVTDAAGFTGQAAALLRVSPATIGLEAEADTYVASDAAGSNFGTSTTLQADASPDRRIFLRFTVAGTAGLAVDGAAVQLVVSTASASESASGGTLYVVGDTTWSETAVTYDTRPVTGPALATAGAVAKSQLVELDASAAVHGDGPVAFAIRTASSDAVKYKSRETASGRPRLAVRVRSLVPGDYAPVVVIMQPGDGSNVPVATPLTLAAQASDAEQGDLSSAITWSSSRDGSLGTGGSITASLSAGVHTITAAVTDGAGHGALDTATVLVGTPPSLAIVAPVDGTLIPPGTAVQLRASATDGGAADLGPAVVWSSDRDGVLGTGTPLAVTLSPGAHVLTVAVSGASGLESRRSIAVFVRPATLAMAPAADVYLNSASPTKNYGLTTVLTADGSPERLVLFRFVLAGTGGPPDRAVLRLTVTAASNAGGVVHAITDTGWQETGVTFATRPPIDGPPVASVGTARAGDVVDFDVSNAIGGDGTYVLALRTASSDGVTYASRESATGVPQLLLTSDALPHGLPQVAITAPADGSTLPFGGAVTFTGVANDPEEGDLSPAITWASDRDGALGVGASITATTLSLGAHVITATSNDAAGNTGTASIAITVAIPATTLVLAPVADVSVKSDAANQPFGHEPTLATDGSPERLTFFRFAVSGTGGRPAARAILRLTVPNVSGAPSNKGGAVHRVTDTGWEEMVLTYATRPLIDGPVLATAGAVAVGNVVDFDVTSAVTGDGPLVLALDTTSSDGVLYASREGASGQPQLLLTVAEPPSATSTPTPGAP